MKKRGFTLIELLGAILILSAIVLIISPLIINQINKGKELTQTQSENNSVSASRNWVNENKKLLPKDGEEITIYISHLQKLGFLEDDVQNINGNDCIVISNHSNVYYYRYHKNNDDFCKNNSIYKIVTLNASENGGTVNNKESQTLMGYKGEKISIPDAISTNTKYNFIGWSTDKNNKTPEINDSYTVNSDVTLYAVYRRPSEIYTLTFDKNGGTGTVNSKSCNTPFLYNKDYRTPSCNINLPSNSFSRSGYAFNGWSTSRTDTSGLVAGSSVTVTSNDIYYATWKSLKPSCTITVSGGSKKVINNNPWYYTGKQIITLNTFNTSSYSFYDADNNRIYAKTDTLDYDVERGIYTATVKSSSGYSSNCSLTISRDTTPPKIYAALNDPDYIVDYDQWGVTHYGQYEQAINTNLKGGTYSVNRIMYRVVAVDFINPFAYLPTEAEGTGGYGSGLKSPIKIVTNNSATTNVTGPSHYDRSTTHRNYLGSYRIDYYKKFSGRGNQKVVATATDALGNSRTVTISVYIR